MEIVESKTRTLPEAKILLYQQKLYCAQARVVDEFNSKWLDDLVDVMTGTMYKHNGIGLAAPQVGVFKRIAVVQLVEDRTKPPFVMINPAIVNSSGSDVDREGCLSIPGTYTRHLVRRPTQILVVFQDVAGKTQRLDLSGMMARVVQHEIDHLEGKFFIHHLSGMKREMILRNYRKCLERMQYGEIMSAYRTEFNVEGFKFEAVEDPRKKSKEESVEDVLRSIGL